jgi:hypothetical protein
MKPQYLNEEFSTAHICRNCRKRYGEHRAIDTKCPPANKKFPRWPVVAQGVDAGAIFDAQTKRYWDASKTFFAPVI